MCPIRPRDRSVGFLSSRSSVTAGPVTVHPGPTLRVAGPPSGATRVWHNVTPSDVGSDGSFARALATTYRARINT